MHVSGSVDPKRDIETINLELILSDLEILDRRIDRTAKAAKGDKSLLTELEFLKRLKRSSKTASVPVPWRRTTMKRPYWRI